MPLRSLRCYPRPSGCRSRLPENDVVAAVKAGDRVRADDRGIVELCDIEHDDSLSVDLTLVDRAEDLRRGVGVEHPEDIGWVDRLEDLRRYTTELKVCVAHAEHDVAPIPGVREGHEIAHHLVLLVAIRPAPLESRLVVEVRPL